MPRLSDDATPLMPLLAATFRAHSRRLILREID